MIPPHLPGNRNHHRQTDRQRAREKNLPHSRFSPLCLHLKRKSNTGYISTPAPTPPIAAFVGLPSARGGPEAASHHSSSTLVCSWQLRALFLPSASRPSPHCHLAPTRTFLLISRASLPLGPPCPRASGEAASQASSLLPSRGPTRPSLPRMWDSHGCPTLLEVRG